MKKDKMEQNLHEEKMVEEVSKQIMAAYNESGMDQVINEDEKKNGQKERGEK